MVLEHGHKQRLEALVRALSAAHRALRLYPAASPIPRQTAESAVEALAALFSEASVVALSITRSGFSSFEEALSPDLMGVGDLVESLRLHGVAECAFTPGCTAEEIVALLTLVGREPDELRRQGSLSTVLLAEGVANIRVADVQLTVLEAVQPAEDEDVEEFLRALARDPEKLAAWFASAAAGDRRAFEESLLELMRVGGADDPSAVLDALSQAFMAQRPDARDVLIGLAIEPGPTKDLAAGMFSRLTSGEIAGSVLEGAFGRNMLSLSTALTRLPLEQVTAQVRAEVQAMLPTTGHSAKEAQFLDHMISVRESAEPEPSLVDADATYRAASEAAKLDEGLIARARDAIGASNARLTLASVRTVLVLLDERGDSELAIEGMETLSGMVPRLLEQGDLDLADLVVTQLSARMSRESARRPHNVERLRQMLGEATGRRSMAALLKATAEDPAVLLSGRRLLAHAPDSTPLALIAEAIPLKSPGLDLAEQLLGRRITDVLAQLALQAQWFELAPIAARLARELDARSLQVLEALMRRQDPQSRREVVDGIAQAGGSGALPILVRALQDENAEVAIVASRALARLGGPVAAKGISERLGQLDIDNADFLLARELIGALARIHDPAAGETLRKLSGRRALIKRGRFAEVQDLVKQAIGYRAQTGAAG